MAIKNHRKRATTKTLSFDVMKTNPAELSKIAETEGLRDFGIYPADDGNGVTFGRPLDKPYEHLGTLPDVGDRQLLVDEKLSFDVRVLFDSKTGITYLEVANGVGSHYSFPFRDVDFSHVRLAAIDLREYVSRFLVLWGIDPLFTAFYWSKGSKTERDQAYDAVVTSITNYYKAVLKPKAKIEIGKKTGPGGIVITEYKEAEGRPKKTEKEINDQREAFQAKMFRAFRKLRRNRKPFFQYRVAMEIFDGERSKPRNELEKAIGNRLRKFGLKWKDLKSDFENTNP